MEVTIRDHARQRVQRYNIGQSLVEEALRHPDNEIAGYSGRRIAQKRLDGYVLRVVYETKNYTKIVVTVYKAKRERYQV